MTASDLLVGSMTASHRPHTTTPLVAMAEIMGGFTEVSQAAALAALKVEMEGLAILFGGTREPRTEAELRADAAETEDGFDNLPI